MRILPIAALAAALAASTVNAQIYPETADSRTSTLFVFGEAGPQVAMSITHGQPKWDTKYEGMLEGLKGRKLRLGSGWWTTMSTAKALMLGDTKIQPGTYVLGLECTTEGKFHLLAINSQMAMEKKWMPWDGKAWGNEIKIPLEFHKGGLEKAAETMEISIELVKNNEPTHGEFSIRWGTHELVANAKFHSGSTPAAEASAEKKEMKDQKMDEKKMGEKKMDEKKGN